MLDDRDLAILRALQADARSTYADIGKRVGLAASSVHERVRKLEDMRASLKPLIDDITFLLDRDKEGPKVPRSATPAK